MSKNYVNVACPVVHNGKHYAGFTLHNGVKITGFQPAGCGVPRTQVMLSGTKTKPFIFSEGISGASIDSKANRGFLGLGRLFGGYLQLKP